MLVPAASAAAAAQVPSPPPATTPSLGQPAPDTPPQNLSPAPAPGATAPVFAAFSLRAASIAFYSNRYVLTADGQVEVRLGDGTRLTGTTFEMDLRLNRFVIAGNVTLYAGGTEYDGAAFSDFLDFDRQYFIPNAPEPDRWTYAGGDYAHPLRGRAMPGDTFFLPDMSQERVFVYSRHAVVQPRESVKFTPASINFGVTFIPFPNYFLNFSPNPNFAQNSLAGAYVDGPLDMYGGGHGLASLHLRFDPQNKVYFAYEQHQVSERHYIVGSINPLTRPLHQYNVVSYDRLSPKWQVQETFQQTAFEPGNPFALSLSKTGFGEARTTLGLPRSYLELVYDQYYNTLLPQPKTSAGGVFYNFDLSHNWVPGHPNQLTLLWNSFQNRIGRSPFYLRTRAGLGNAHTDQPGGLQTFGNVAYPTIWNDLVGFNVSLPSLRLIKDESGFGRDLNFNASFDKQRQWYSLPHHVDTTIANLSLNRAFDRHLNWLLNYTVTNIGDYYGARQLEVYPAAVYFSPQTGQAFPSWSAFRGLSTTRSLATQFLYTPSTAFTTILTLRKNHDFPEPVPGFAPQYQQLVFQNYGVTPYEARLEVRFRVNQQLTLDVARSYWFNFGGYQRWSPAFSVQVLK